MTDATKRSILRSIHIVFGIPIIGYIYSPFKELPNYAPVVRFVALPVIAYRDCGCGKAISFDDSFRKLVRCESERANRAASKQRIPISDTKLDDQNLDPFQSKTLPARREREGRLLDFSRPAKERQREASLARHDRDRRHHQWRRFSSRGRARRRKKSLAQG